MIKLFRTFDGSKEILKWLKESGFEEDTDWYYYPTGTLGLPDLIDFDSEELHLMFILRWSERRAIPKYVNGKRAGYLNSP